MTSLRTICFYVADPGSEHTLMPKQVSLIPNCNPSESTGRAYTFFSWNYEKKKKPHEVRNTTSNFQIRKLTLHDFSMHTSRQVKIQNSSKAETGTQNAWVQNNLSLFLLCIWHCDSSWEKNWGLVQNLFLHKKGTVKLYRYLDTATGTIPLTAQILIHSIAN